MSLFKQQSDRGRLKVVLATHREYAFTLRKTNLKKGQPTDEDYVKHIGRFKELGVELIDNIFEHTSGLHMHGILRIPKKLNLIRLRIRGWSIKIDELFNREGWVHYYLKDQKIRDDAVESADYLSDELTDELLRKSEERVYNLKRSLFRNFN